MAQINHSKIRRVIAGVDWGFANPGVIQVWAIDNDGRMYLVHEVYQTKKTIDWWIDRAKEIESIFEVETFVCDPSEPAFISQFNANGLHAIKANNDISPGIQAVQRRLSKAGDGKPRLFMMRGALVQADSELLNAHKPTCTQQEIDVYVWPKAQDGRPIKETPVKEHDHGMDAMRYTAMYIDGADSGGTFVSSYV